jgi:hypothetical protein
MKLALKHALAVIVLLLSLAPMTRTFIILLLLVAPAHAQQRPNLGEITDQTLPPKPKPTPPSRAEMLATIRMIHAADDPDVQRMYAPIVAAEQAKRKFADELNVKEWESRITNYLANQAAKRKLLEPAR